MRTLMNRVSRGSWAAVLVLTFAPSGVIAQEPVSAATPAPEFQSEYEGLRKEFDQALRGFYQAYSELKTDAERKSLWADPVRNPELAFAPRFRAFAERAGKHPAAAAAWSWLMQKTEDPQEQAQIVARMLAEFLNAPAIADFAADLPMAEWTLGRPKTVEALRTIRAKSQDSGGRLAAALSLGRLLTAGSHETEKTEGHTLLEEVVRTAPDSPGAQQATHLLFELDHLQIGMIVPEIAGVDSAGQAFHLSDYRGKVVVLDFWGFW